MANMNCFVGIGDLGNMVAAELSAMLLDVDKVDPGEQASDFISENLLGIHKYPVTDSIFLEGDHGVIILAGSTHDPLWEEARSSLYEHEQAMMLSIVIGAKGEINADPFKPFTNECIVFPDPSLFDPGDIAQLVLQFFFIHTPWIYRFRYRGSEMGSIIGYDLGDTAEIFAGKRIQALKIKSNMENFRQLYTDLIRSNHQNISQAQAMLISFWGKNDILTLHLISEFVDEIKDRALPDSQIMFTAHVLPEDGPDFMVTLFHTL